jgi:hypothetical protein
MSEPTPPALDQQPKRNWKQNPMLRYILGVILLLGCIYVLVLALTVQANRRELAAMERGVDALSVACVPTFLTQDEKKISELCSQIKAEGKFESVSMYDLKQKLIGKSDGTAFSTSYKAPPLHTSHRNEGDWVVLERALTIGGTTEIGAIQVVYKP